MTHAEALLRNDAQHTSSSRRGEGGVSALVFGVLMLNGTSVCLRCVRRAAPLSDPEVLSGFPSCLLSLRVQGCRIFCKFFRIQGLTGAARC